MSLKFTVLFHTCNAYRGTQWSSDDKSSLIGAFHIQTGSNSIWPELGRIASPSSLSSCLPGSVMINGGELMVELMVVS
jgi:hypothetical protein